LAIDTDVRPAPGQLPANPGRHRGDWFVVALFTFTAFCGAGLLFVVEPLIAKLLLPSYGGSATVWSTTTLFFQVLLLLAYGYVHWSTSRLGSRWQPRLHLAVLLVPLLALPLAIPADAAPADDVTPALWLLRTLLLVVGLPFAVIATTGPMVGRPLFLVRGQQSGQF
jgi:hypothetical protein